MSINKINDTYVQVKGINQPYWGAGKQFGFTGWGVSIKESDLQEAERYNIDIHIPILYFKKKYKISHKMARKKGFEFVREYRGKNIPLWCIPQSALTEVEDDQS